MRATLFAPLAFVIVATPVIVAGCSGKVVVVNVDGGPPGVGPGNQGGGDGGTDPIGQGPTARTCGAFPDPPSVRPGPSSGVVLAMSALFLGDTDRNFVPSTTAWQSFGLNIDGKVTTASSTDVCRLAPGASRDVQSDGTCGIDNAYGSRVIPIYQTFSHDVSKAATAAIAQGLPTLLFELDGIAPGADSASPLRAAIYESAPLSGPPKWDGTGAWPVAFSSVQGGDLRMPLVAGNDAYVAGETFVFRSSVPLIVHALTIGGTAQPLRIHGATVTMKLSPDHQSATGGTISGVLDVEEYIADFKAVAGQISSSLCSGSTFDAIAQQIRQAADIGKDGTNDPSKACDGISIGLGFEAKAALLGAVAPPPMPSPDPCH